MTLPRTHLLKLISTLLLLTLVANVGCVAQASRETMRGSASASGTAAGTTGTPASPAPGAENPAPPAQPATRPAPDLHLQAATVVRVVDGDTAQFRLADGTVERVRFIGVNTPESTIRHEPYGAEASAYTKRVLEVGRQVQLELDAEHRDKYGRLLAYVWLTAPTTFDSDDRPAFNETSIRMFNAKLMRDGMAQVMTIPPNVKYQDYFLQLQREARSNGSGLWGDSAAGAAADPAPAPAPTAVDPAPAPAPTLVAPSSAGGSYIGNRNTMKFHYPSCASVGQMNPANKVPLASRAAAVSAGYIPCGNCKP